MEGKEQRFQQTQGKNTVRFIIIGIIIIALILIAGTIWTGRSASRDTTEAVRSVSLLYLDELAGRREQVVEDNLNDNINDINAALSLLTPEDLQDISHLQAYQSRMRTLFKLERFAFVDEDGLVYTADGVKTDIDQYGFDYKNITGPEISVNHLDSAEKEVVIAVPVSDISIEGKKVVAFFTEQDMQVMLHGVSVTSQNTGATFCNIYTSGGVALSNTVLGGLAVEDNLLEAMTHAEFDDGYSLEGFYKDFAEGNRGVVSFTYDGIQETLAYVPVNGTDWMLTYLIRESVISERIGSVSSGIIVRSLIQSAVTALVLLGLFIVLIRQTKKAAQIALEKEAAEAENRVKNQELEQRLALQEKLLEQERQKAQQDKLITALASDYRSVYYLELDKDDCICYQKHSDLDDGFNVGQEFHYLQAVTDYANRYITDQYRDEFLRFIQPDAIREALATERVISYRYMVQRHGKESYEMVRFAGVRHPEDRDDHLVHAVGACFTDVDAETRKSLAESEALSAALATAEQANKAKTAFLSSMSHEIRTPMNAIIGLDNIALNDPETPEKTRGYLEKIGSSAEHLLNLINDILDMSRIESGRMVLKNEEFSFPKLLEALNTMFSGQCQDKGLDYQCHIKGQVDDYYIGDNMKLRQVLINILGNAVKFTPKGGRIDFDVERVAKFDGKTTLKFTISDTGIGMSKDYLPHIFDTFSQEDSSTTSKYGSSGLGLAITKSIVEMMNGNITVESEKGAGSTFTVAVTLLDSDRKDSENAVSEISPHDMSVLVIDDDPVACEHAKLVLEKAGIASETAASGAEAIEMVKLRHARMEPYNLILVDWKMPEMDGIETTKRIREIVGDESAIIILTAYRWDDVLEEAVSAGVDSFIPKPLFAAAVIEEFRDAVKRKNLPAMKAAKKADLTGKRILLAEDMAVNAEIMIMVLQMREMEVELAENGRIAVDKFSESPVGHYDAILMDMRMPEMDGLEATRTIRALDRPDAKTIPIIALTANAFDEDVQRSLQAGLNAHLSKPVEPDNLFETLENLIQE
ncbi:MAG: response regulator [Oscillospiraceae bacterium]|nr:response regulator [Oscillospiraceae bacterium]